MIDKTSFIRKRSWGFFKNFWLSGKTEFLPSIEITSITEIRPNIVVINGVNYELDSLVEITKEESMALNHEFSLMKLSETIITDISAHIRKDTGLPKECHEKGYALRYCFTFNKKNPGIIMQAYRCNECNNIHCGTSVAEVAIEAVVTKKECQHAYSKSMNQVYPRLCINCREPEENKV